MKLKILVSIATPFKSDHTDIVLPTIFATIVTFLLKKAIGGQVNAKR